MRPVLRLRVRAGAIIKVRARVSVGVRELSETNVRVKQRASTIARGGSDCEAEAG